MKPKQSRKRRKPYFAATREGQSRVTLPLTRAAHKDLKRLALDLDLSLEGVLREAVAGLLKQHGRPTDELYRQA
jgi:hypothetical protein